VRVLAPGDVRVSVPLRTPESDVKRFIRERIGWIHEAEKRVKPRSMPTKAQRDAARVRLARYLDENAPIWVERLGLTRRKPQFFIRQMRTRWGSCTPATARIRLALALGNVPDKLKEYVLVHELVHLYERGHGPGFQARMSAALPDWKARRKKLRTMPLG